MLFQYAQLGPSTIRLVRFHPRSTLLDLHVNVEHQAKYSERNAQYSVLSYETATEVERKGITLNGRTRMIDPNAWCALQAVWMDHTTSSSDRFWLDAICVNHADGSEVREQEKQLSSIYAAADQVILWLRPESAEAETEALARRAALYIQTAMDRGALGLAKKLVVWGGERRVAVMHHVLINRWCGIY